MVHSKTLKFIVIHLEKILAKRGSIYRIYVFEHKNLEEYTYRDVLRIGDLKILKCYDFWIPETELHYRTEPEIDNVSELKFKIVHITSISGRIMKISILDNFNEVPKFIENFSSYPKGVRVLGDFICLGFSENIYVISKSDYRDVDIEFMYGNVTRFIIGSSLKNFYRNLEKLNMYAESGVLGRKKLSFFVDFVLPV